MVNAAPTPEPPRNLRQTPERTRQAQQRGSVRQFAQTPSPSALEKRVSKAASPRAAPIPTITVLTASAKKRRDKEYKRKSRSKARAELSGSSMSSSPAPSSPALIHSEIPPLIPTTMSLAPPPVPQNWLEAIPEELLEDLNSIDGSLTRNPISASSIMDQAQIHHSQIDPQLLSSPRKYRERNVSSKANDQDLLDTCLSLQVWIPDAPSDADLTALGYKKRPSKTRKFDSVANVMSQYLQTSISSKMYSDRYTFLYTDYIQRQNVAAKSSGQDEEQNELDTKLEDIRESIRAYTSSQANKAAAATQRNEYAKIQVDNATSHKKRSRPDDDNIESEDGRGMNSSDTAATTRPSVRRQKKTKLSLVNDMLEAATDSMASALQTQVAASTSGMEKMMTAFGGMTERLVESQNKPHNNGKALEDAMDSVKARMIAMEERLEQDKIERRKDQEEMLQRIVQAMADR